MSDELVPFLARLPLDVKACVEAQASCNRASQDSKIVRAIRAQMLAANHAAEVHKILCATKLKELAASSRQSRRRKLQATKPSV
jgi:hypothetical protein